MTKKIRTILFFTLLFIFLMIAPSIIFYSWGYRFNFETKKIVKTGAFYFKILPKSAQIYLAPLNNKEEIVKENEFMKKTDFFFGAALIENLLPQKYEINVQKDGFHSWKKILEIRENQVAEAKNIVLIPQDPRISLVTQNVESFFPSPDEKIIVLKETNEASGTSSGASLSNENGADWALKIFDVGKNVKSHLIEIKDISKNSQVSLLDLKFSPNAKTIILKTGIKEQLKYYLLDLSKTPVKAEALDFLDEDVVDFSFHPINNQKLFILRQGEILEADIAQNKVSESRLKNVKSFQISNNNFYYLDNSGFLFKTDLSFLRQEKINSQPFSLQTEMGLTIYIMTDWTLLSDGQKLYWLNPNSGSFEKFFETKSEPKISPDFKKMAYFSDYEIWVLFLKEEFGQPPKKAGERLFIARFSEKVDKVIWLNSHYLIFNSGEKIKIAEIDDRNMINIIDLAEFLQPEIFWNQVYKKLFILSDGDFYGSKALLP